jgi:hypothetical protein
MLLCRWRRVVGPARHVQRILPDALLDDVLKLRLTYRSPLMTSGSNRGRQQ